MSDYPMLISNKLHSFRNFGGTKIHDFSYLCTPKNFKLREDEENKNNLPCYPVDIAFAGFL